MDSRNFDQDTAEYAEELRRILQANSAKDALNRFLLPDDAVYANNLGRLAYGAPEEPISELITGAVTSRLPLTEQTFTELARRAEYAGDPGHHWFGLKRAVRTGFAAAESLWENGLPRLTRTAIRAYRGEDPWEAWQGAGGGYLGQMVRSTAQGEDYTLGEGFFPAPRNPADIPGYEDQIHSNIQRGIAPHEAEQRANEWATANFPTDIVSKTWEAAENTQLYRTRGGTTYASPVSLGRLAAIQVSDPGSIPFNLMSTIIDGYTRVGLDPIDVGFDEWRLWRQGANRIMPNVGTEAGLRQSWRPWLNPVSAEDWFARREGRRVVDFLTENTSFRETDELLKPMTPADKLRVTRSDNPDEIRNVLREYFGAIAAPEQAPRLSRRQRAFGAVLPMDERKGFQGAITTIRNDSVIGRSVHRWLAETGYTVLDPQNPNQTIEAARNWLDTALVGRDETDRILETLAENAGDYYGMQGAWDSMIGAFERRVGSLGYTPHEEAHILRQIMDNQLQTTRYYDDVAGNEVIQFNSRFWDDTGGNRHFVPSGHVEAEFQHRAIYMPNVREVRRATARWRAFNQKLWRRGLGEFGEGNLRYFKDPLGIEPWALARALDPVAGLWRNFALMRVGWPLRVIPEELLRQGAAGYNDIIRHPMSYLALAFTDLGMTGIADDSLQSVFNAKHLGAGGFPRNLANDVADTRFVASGKPFTTVRRPATADSPFPLTARQRSMVEQYNQGLAREFTDLYMSDTPRLVAEHGVDHTFVYLQSDEGIEIVKANAKAADPGTPWDKIWNNGNIDQHALRAHLQSIEGRIRTKIGGRWYTRVPDDTGDFFTGRWVDQYGAEASIDDIPELADVGDDLYYFPVDDGAEGRYELRDLIWSGKSPDGDQVLWPEMGASDREAFEEFIGNFDPGGGWQPDAVKMPIDNLDKRLRDVYDHVTNTVFSALMELPTQTLVRSPFARLEYMRQVARMYVWADDPARAKIRAWARAEGMINPFDDAVRENLKLQNLKDLPDMSADTLRVVGEGDKVDDIPAAFSFEEADTFAKYHAAEKTRELFYDLQKRGNWADMTRLIFPFADAWWEVLSRWAKFLDPTGLVPGQAAGSTAQSWRNIRRLGVGLTAGRRVGFFDENEYGDEVFNFPALGSMGLPFMPPVLSDVEGARLRGEASMEALLFIDPTARGFMAPGGGPWSQIAANLVTPILPKPLKDAANWVAYGEFTPPRWTAAGDVLESLFPTYGRRFSEMLGVLANGEADEYYADDIMLMATAIRLSGDDRGVADSPDKARWIVDTSTRAGSNLSLMRMFEAFYTPAQPQYLKEALLEVMDTDGEMRDLWFNVAGLNREWQEALEAFGDDELAASRWWLQTYGFDPLNVTSQSRFIKDRPTTESEGVYRENHPDLEVFDRTMMMWVPDYSEIEEIDMEYWNRQFDADEAAREDLTASQSIQVVNSRAAWKKIENLRETRDAGYAECELTHSKGSSQRVACNEATRQWYNEELNKVTAFDGPYWAWGLKDEGSTERPTYGSLMKEILQAGTPGSDLYGAASRLNPELHSFVVDVRELWEEVEDYGKAKGNQADWWLTASGDEAQITRDWFVETLNHQAEALQRTANPDTMDGVRWMFQHVLTPLLEGWDWDDQVWFMPEEPPAPLQDRTDRPQDDVVDGPFLEEGPA